MGFFMMKILFALLASSFHVHAALQDYTTPNIKFHNCNDTQGPALLKLVADIKSFAVATISPDANAGASPAFATFFSTNHGPTVATIFRDMATAADHSSLDEGSIEETKFACLNEEDPEWYVNNMRWWCNQNSLLTVRNEEWHTTFLCPLFWEVPSLPAKERCPAVVGVEGDLEPNKRAFVEQEGALSVGYNQYTSLVYELEKFYIPDLIPRSKEKTALNDCVEATRAFQLHHAWNYAYYATCKLPSRGINGKDALMIECSLAGWMREYPYRCNWTWRCWIP